MLSNFDLENMAEADGLDLIGVYSKNLLPEERRVGSYIINMEDHDAGSGSHWTAFKIFENGKCCYFDSFGFLPPKDVDIFLKPFKPIATNNRAIQHIKSDKCGYFCIAFIKYFNDFNVKKDIYEAYDDFLNSFSNNTKTNDKIVMDLIRKL